MDDKLQKIQLPSGETLHIKKSLTGYSIVHPIKKDVDKPLSFDNIDWNNFLFGGNIWYAIQMILIFAAIIGVILYFNAATTECVYVQTHLKEICSEQYNLYMDKLKSYNDDLQGRMQLNISQINLSAQENG